MILLIYQETDVMNDGGSLQQEAFLSVKPVKW
jgi:hypothetical protein